MTEGVFQKLFIGVILLGAVVTGFSIWSTSLFSTYGVTMNRSIDFINKTAKIQEDTNTLYYAVTHVTLLNFVENAILGGWTTLQLVFGMLDLFINLPNTIIHVLIPDSTVTAWLGPLLNAIFTGIIVWAGIALYIRNRQGTV